jgi:hypothetical protein
MVSIARFGPTRPLLVAALLIVIGPDSRAAGKPIGAAGQQQVAVIGLTIDISKAVDQNQHSQNACGPASVLNSLIFGNHHLQTALARLKGSANQDKLAFIIDRYGTVRSEDYQNRPRWNPQSGISPLDLTHLFIDILATGSQTDIQGKFLDRDPDESHLDHLHRVHGYLVHSLQKGVPPIISLRSFAPDYISPDQKKIVWNGLANHYVIITALPRMVHRHQKGFFFDYLDPNGPLQASGYAYIEDRRNFMAAKGNRVHWKWLSDGPFLLVTAPSLNTLGLRTQRWFWRTIIVFNYAIGHWQ